MGCGSSNSVNVIQVQPATLNNEKYDTVKPSIQIYSERQGQQQVHSKPVGNDYLKKSSEREVPNEQISCENEVKIAKTRQGDNKNRDGEKNGRTVVTQKGDDDKHDKKVRRHEEDKDETKTDLDEDYNGDGLEYKTWTVFDTFWTEKQMLMKDVDRIEIIDQHALQAPRNLRLNSQKLVEYLTQITRTDFEKFRVIFRWIADNIKYDVGFLDGRGMGATEAESVLKNGYSVCAGYSNLYSYLCRMAGLECIGISGLAKGAHYYPGMTIPIRNSSISHAWNQINIDGKRYLCDATWAAGYPNVVNGKRHFTFKFNECWFITEPAAFGATHLPLNMPYRHNDDIDTVALLMDSPYTTCNDWNNEPLKHPGYFSNCLECISHDTGVIRSKNNQVEIVMKLRHPVETFLTLKNISKGKETSALQNKYAMYYIREDSLVLSVRLPKSGDYMLTICGKPYGMSEEDKEATVNTRLVSFKIVETGMQRVKPFPAAGGLGTSWQFKANGLHTTISTPLIEAKNGKTAIEIIRKNGILPMVSSLCHEDDNNQTDLSNCTYGEVCDKRRVRFHIRCPKPGNYVFKLFVKYPADEKGYEQSASFVISCSGSIAKETFPSDTSVLWGPSDFMNDLGIETASQSSTITTENNGEATLRLHLPGGVKILPKLFDVKGESVSQTWMCAETLTKNGQDGSRGVNLLIRCPKVGMYRLMLYGNRDNIKSNHYIGRWMVECNTPCDGQLFPHNHGLLWGPKPHFDSLGLVMVSPESSTIKTKNGLATLSMNCKRKDYRANKLSHSLLVNGKTAHLERRCVMAEITSDGDDIAITYHFRLISKAFYHFNLWGNPRTMNNNSLAGQWMIVCDEPSSSENLFPEHNKPWGPVEGFDKFNLQVQEPKSSTLHTYSGKCALVIESKQPLDTVQQLKKAGADKSIDQTAVTVTKEAKDGKHLIKIQFDIPQPGYYGYDLWAKHGNGQEKFTYVGKWLVLYE